MLKLFRICLSGCSPSTHHTALEQQLQVITPKLRACIQQNRSSIIDLSQAYCRAIPCTAPLRIPEVHTGVFTADPCFLTRSELCCEDTKHKHTEFSMSPTYTTIYGFSTSESSMYYVCVRLPVQTRRPGKELLFHHLRYRYVCTTVLITDKTKTSDIKRFTNRTNRQSRTDF